MYFSIEQANPGLVSNILQYGFSGRLTLRPDQDEIGKHGRLSAEYMTLTFHPAFVQTALLPDPLALFWAHTPCDRSEHPIRSQIPRVGHGSCLLTFRIAAVCIAGDVLTSFVYQACLCSGHPPELCVDGRRYLLLVHTIVAPGRDIQGAEKHSVGRLELAPLGSAK